LAPSTSISLIDNSDNELQNRTPWKDTQPLENILLTSYFKIFCVVFV
jgi:hypothetical protein